MAVRKVLRTPAVIDATGWSSIHALPEDCRQEVPEMDEARSRRPDQRVVGR